MRRRRGRGYPLRLRGWRHRAVSKGWTSAVDRYEWEPGNWEPEPIAAEGRDGARLIQHRRVVFASLARAESAARSTRTARLRPSAQRVPSSSDVTCGP